MTKEIQHKADAAMFDAAPIKKGEIKVHLLWMTPDPLGAIAAACRMYEGYPTYHLEDITDDEREKYWEQVQKTHLKAPLEFVKFHFFIEGVDRAFTHQMVRQRTAVYAQESMRFAVKDNMANEVSLPPSLPAGSGEEEVWNETLRKIEATYKYLIVNGIPAEDARGILPIATPTRLNYCTDLRALLDHAGNRLCTQAQFHWRVVFAKIREAIRNHYFPTTDRYPEMSEEEIADFQYQWQDDYGWQFQKISEIFLPVCYQKGKCPFKAKFDRGCTIRERVDLFEEHNIPSSEWDKDRVVTESGELTADEEEIRAAFGPEPGGYEFVPGIRTEEWLEDPQAARVKVGDEYGDQSDR